MFSRLMSQRASEKNLVTWSARRGRTKRLVLQEKADWPCPWLHLYGAFPCSGRALHEIDMAPMLTASKPDGSWSERSVTTSEAKKWFRKMLRSFDLASEYTTVHTLKGTPLSWCTKGGLDPCVGQLLGHHPTGKSSAECYGRDNLAKPLREIDSAPADSHPCLRRQILHWVMRMHQGPKTQTPQQRWKHPIHHPKVTLQGSRAIPKMSHLMLMIL